jgi:hypothetical protein
MKDTIDKEKAKRNIKEILDKLRDCPDISLLHEYQKLYKKEISIFRRSWAAAWLFMYYDKKETPGPGSAETSPSWQSKKVSYNAEERAPVSESVPVIPEEESKRLFISIGKNRRLFPREIITLIMTKTQTPREDIGIIRILDNYSFVQVRDIRADEIIEALNGVKFRGRTLAVNFAKAKNADETNKEEQS